MFKNSYSINDVFHNLTLQNFLLLLLYIPNSKTGLFLIFTPRILLSNDLLSMYSYLNSETLSFNFIGLVFQIDEILKWIFSSVHPFGNSPASGLDKHFANGGFREQEGKNRRKRKLLTFKISNYRQKQRKSRYES